MTIVPALVAHLGIRGVVGHPGRCRSLILRGVGTGTTHRSLAIAQLCRPASQWFLTLDDGPRIGPVILHADDPERLMGGPLRWDIFSLPDGCHVVPTKAQPKMLAQRWPKKRLPTAFVEELSSSAKKRARAQEPHDCPVCSARTKAKMDAKARAVVDKAAQAAEAARQGRGRWNAPYPTGGRYDLPMGSPGLGKRR